MERKKVIIIGIVILGLLIILGAFLLNNKDSKDDIGNEIVNENNKEGHTNLDSSRVLVIYFSKSLNTQKLAKIISDEVGGDFRRIEPVKDYPDDYDELLSIAKRERDNDERPSFKDLDINIDDYDTIFIGYPIWHYTLPMVVYTFFDEYDLSGKTIIPFNTHGGVGNGGTYETIKELERLAKVLDGLAINGEDMKEDQSIRVKSWLKELGFIS